MRHELVDALCGVTSGSSVTRAGGGVPENARMLVRSVSISVVSGGDSGRRYFRDAKRAIEA